MRKRIDSAQSRRLAMPPLSAARQHLSSIVSDHRQAAAAPVAPKVLISSL